MLGLRSMKMQFRIIHATICRIGDMAEGEMGEMGWDPYVTSAMLITISSAGAAD